MRADALAMHEPPCHADLPPCAGPQLPAQRKSDGAPPQFAPDGPSRLLQTPAQKAEIATTHLRSARRVACSAELNWYAESRSRTTARILQRTNIEVRTTPYLEHRKERHTQTGDSSNAATL